MLLKKIVLHNFRNFDHKIFSLSPNLTVIFGENAKGKTNLLEAIFCLTAGEGFRETREEELINFDKKNSQIDGEFIDKNLSKILQIKLTKSSYGINKNYYINRVKKRWIQYLPETVKSVLFSPQQLEIITGPPELRRRYLDKIISFYDNDYKKKLINYENALRKRNKLLENFKNESALKEELFFWDGYLTEQARYVKRARQNYTSFLNENRGLDSKKFFVKYLFSELTEEKLRAVFDKEKRYRRTLIGPQKDDFAIYMEKDDFQKNLQLYGSRSEHRLSIFWLEINEIRYYEQKYHRKPILLLDDVFSELDKKNRKLVLNLIKDHQTIATTAETEVIDLIKLPKLLINL